VKTSSSQIFGVALTLATLIVLTTGRSLRAQAAPASDELKISTAAGAPVADIFIPETVGAGSEPSALFAPGTGLPTLVPPGTLSGSISSVGASYVVLAEPFSEPVDPTELPPVTFVGLSGPVVVSDLLINGIASSNFPFIALISNNNPDLATFVAGISRGTPIQTETGALQDLTALIGPAVFPSIGPIDVQVQSDLTGVPEPSTFTLAALGAAALHLAARVRGQQNAPRLRRHGA